MIRALIIGLMQSANRASAGILVKNFNFRRNTGDKDHSSKVQGSERCSLVFGRRRRLHFKFRNSNIEIRNKLEN